jgi:putative ABC transport system permease protein
MPFCWQPGIYLRMLKHYLKITWRNLAKDRRFTLLNLLGLSTGLACTLLIWLWVTDELRMDKFYGNDDRLFQVMENRVQADRIWTATSASAPEASALAKEMPEVQYAVATMSTRKSLLAVGDKNLRGEGRLAGDDFFHVFSYRLLYGNADQVLTDKHSIVLSDVLAKKLFGTTDNVVGQSITFDRNQTYRISGIFEAPGIHSSEQFDYVMPILNNPDFQRNLTEWGNTFCSIYLLLKPGTSPMTLNKKLAGYIKLHTNGKTTYRTPFLQRYSDIYLNGRYEGGASVGGRIEYVRLFSLIAAFILVIACINFMNLSTAKAAGRAKEVGIKKVVGAGRGSLIFQYLGESMAMAIASVILAFVWVAIALPAFNGITGKQLSLDHLTIGFALTAAGITLITGLIAGSYPALYLSAFRPVQVLKGKLKTALGEVLIRKGLVVFQFTLSIVLIVAVGIIYRQIEFIQSKPLGYDRDHLLSIELEGRLADSVRLQATFLEEARRIPGVLNASATSHTFTGHNDGTYGVEWPGKDPNDRTEFEVIAGETDMTRTLGMTIKEGRAFSRDFPSDSSGIIFNEAGIRFMGMKDPIGKQVVFEGKKATIVGVVNDFHFQSLHEKVKPAVIVLKPEYAYRLLIRLAADREKSAIAGLDRLYQQFNPGWAFDYTFMGQTYQTIYTAEKRVSILSRYFAGLAILISCLGLFGLSAFTAQRRNKEIGIRKVLGASVGGVVALLSGDFLKLVGLAILIAFPLAWWISNQWLKGFAYHIPIHAGIFVLAAAFIIGLAFLTISFQSVKAALANPAKSLRSE